jgi:restriction endonuclease S subunit
MIKQTQIPIGWQFQELGDIGEFKNGINKNKEDFGHGVPFVNLMDVFGISKLNPKEFALVDASPSEVEAYSLKRDVLFVRSSVKPSGVGLTTVVDEDIKNTVYSGFLIRFRSNGMLAAEFARYCFNSTSFRKIILSKSTISANTNINQQALSSLTILLPPIAEQKKIAEILGCWDEAIALTEKAIEVKQKLKASLTRKLLFRCTANQDKALLGKLIELKHGYAFSSEFFSDKRTEKILLTPGNFHINGTLYFGKNTKYYLGETNEEFHLKNGDLLIVMTDLTKDMNILGNSVILESSKIVLHNQRIGKVSIKDPSQLDKSFLRYLLNSDICRDHVKKTATGTTVRGCFKSLIASSKSYKSP